MSDTIHKIDEFPYLPWSQLDPERCGKDWSFGRGGHGFDDQTWTLSVLDQQAIDVHIWELPPALGAVIAMWGRCERNSMRHEIRVALGLN